MTHKVHIEATIESVLSPQELRDQLVVALYDVETEEQISDGDGPKLQVLDYDDIDVTSTE